MKRFSCLFHFAALAAAFCLLTSSAAGADARRQTGDQKLNDAFWDSNGEISELKSLLAKGASVNAKNEHGQTRLECAVRFGKVDEVKFLLDAGADANCVSDYGTPLSVAAESLGELANLDVSQSQDLINITTVELPDTPEIRAKLDRTMKEQQKAAANDPLIPTPQSMRRDRLRIFQLLLSHHADPNRDTGHGGRALITAASVGSLDAARALLDSGARVNDRDADGQTALMCPGGKEQIAIARLLLQRGALINVRDARGETPLAFAAIWNCTPLIRLYLSSGANPNTHDTNGKTPLSYVISTHNTEAVAVLHAAQRNRNGAKD